MAEPPTSATPPAAILSQLRPGRRAGALSSESQCSGSQVVAALQHPRCRLGCAAASRCRGAAQLCPASEFPAGLAWARAPYCMAPGHLAVGGGARQRTLGGHAQPEVEHWLQLWRDIPRSVRKDVQKLPDAWPVVAGAHEEELCERAPQPHHRKRKSVEVATPLDTPRGRQPDNLGHGGGPWESASRAFSGSPDIREKVLGVVTVDKHTMLAGTVAGSCDVHRAGGSPRGKLHGVASAHIIDRLSPRSLKAEQMQRLHLRRQRFKNGTAAQRLAWLQALEISAKAVVDQCDAAAACRLFLESGSLVVRAAIFDGL